RWTGARLRWIGMCYQFSDWISKIWASSIALMTIIITGGTIFSPVVPISQGRFGTMLLHFGQ
ncbi:MAG: hypothetical protein ACPGWR_30180, partial [Ardenticatenaceae bacterium]